MFKWIKKLFSSKKPKKEMDLSKLTKGDLYKLLKAGKISADKIKP
jgi:hypothetical protein